MAYSRRKNPFDEEDDFHYGNRNTNPFDDDDDYIRRKQRTNPFEEEDNNFEDVGKSPEFMRLQQEKELLEKRMVDSSFRSVNMINESQQVAGETAEDLMIQREKLERTNKTLDKMQDDLNSTDRNINSMKSIWGTMTNWFKKPLKPSTNDTKTDNTDAIDSMKESNQNNATRVGGLDNFPKSSPAMHHQPQMYQQSNNVNDVVDRNLDNMLAGLTMLKGQAVALGEEVDYQNQLLDTISQKVDKTDDRITNQDSKIRKMLK